jgi:hypothetical protein
MSLAELARRGRELELKKDAEKQKLKAAQSPIISPLRKSQIDSTHMRSMRSSTLLERLGGE